MLRASGVVVRALRVGLKYVSHRVDTRRAQRPYFLVWDIKHSLEPHLSNNKKSCLLDLEQASRLINKSLHRWIKVYTAE